MQNTENSENMEVVQSSEGIEKMPRTGKKPSFALSILLDLSELNIRRFRENKLVIEKAII